ncbi:LysM peptidoglycan-binding domain-containing protein [Brevibacillus choshinensis]|uniref:LysM peptidoglycan-binding domain-containing protein n=1 Tax=Brevibacillus choshinensis TaxID=54911 RepID=UPI002E1B4D28|nr:LysM peptidoglycan-binding domain-containing protein [Brevibacillus choshinensis]
MGFYPYPVNFGFPYHPLTRGTIYAPSAYPSPYPIPVSDLKPMQNYCVCISKSEDKLSKTFRTLWEQHVAWTRMVIISIAANLPDENLTTKRLLRNPGDMAKVLEPFYGTEISKEFEKLFTDHLVIAAELVKAAKAGNSRAAADAEHRWYVNADEIAAFLNSINPYWQEETLRAMLQEHLALTKNEAVYRLAKDFASDISTFDKIEQQALEMADAFPFSL